MVTAVKTEEYLAKIREVVCSRCVERPAGGPPCAALGKRCGIEMHLPQLIDSIHQVHSGSIVPYLESNQRQVCACCPLLHSEDCPCPMERLVVLVVEAVEEVDEARQRQTRAENLLHGVPPRERADVEGVPPGDLLEEGSARASGCPAREDLFTLFVRTSATVPHLKERPVLRCQSHEEARRLQRELRELGLESVIRLVGESAAGD